MSTLLLFLIVFLLVIMCVELAFMDFTLAEFYKALKRYEAERDRYDKGHSS